MLQCDMHRVVYAGAYEIDIGRHVFPTEKFRLVAERLIGDGVITPDDILAPLPLGRAALERVHTADYLDDFLALRPTWRVQRSELPISAAIRDAYCLAAGGTLAAARLALQHGAAMHLGGGYHHAMPAHAEGFCYLNDIAVALRVLLDEGAIARGAVIDTDVHQGNGTARVFHGDPAVFTFSIHQENNYPMKEQSDLDIGLPDGIEDAAYLAALEPAVHQVLQAHDPDLVLMVAGADPYREDLLGGLRLSLDGLRRRDALVVRACAERGVPVVGLTAGGYARVLADTVAIHCNTTREILAWPRYAKRSTS